MARAAGVGMGKHNYDDYGEKCLQQIMNLQTKKSLRREARAGRMPAQKDFNFVIMIIKIFASLSAMQTLLH